MKIVHNTPKIILKQIFETSFLPFWPYDFILTPKIALFDHFEQFFVDLGLFLSITWNVPHKIIVEIVHDTLEIFETIFFKISHDFGPRA